MLDYVKYFGCRVAARSLVQPIGGVNQPGIDVLTHSGQHEPEEPTVSASGADLQETAVKFLALDRALSTRASILVAQPQVAISGDDGMEAIVFLGIGVDDPTVA